MHLVQRFSADSVVYELLFMVFQLAICRADNVLIVRNFVYFHEFFQFWKKKQKSLKARTTHLVTRQLKHWLPSKMPALNYSVTHRMCHSCSYCMANGWLEDQEQFFYNGIRALEKCWTRCILIAGEYVKKVTKYDLHIS